MRKIIATIIFILLIIGLVGCGTEDTVLPGYKLDDIKIGVSDSFDVQEGVFPLNYNIENEGRLKTEINLSVQLSVKDELDNAVPVIDNTIVIVAGKVYTVNVTAVTKLGSKSAVFTIRAIDSAGNQYDNVVESISLQAGTLKSLYSINEPLSLDGAVLRVVYESGNTSTLALKPEWVTNFSTVSVGTRIMGITYGGKSCSFEYTVKNEFISNGLSFRFIEVSDSFEIVSGVPAANGSVTIPKTYSGKPVTAIAEKAFENSQQLSSVVFSAQSNIKTIGARAFANCIKINEIALPPSVTKMGEAAFSGCRGLYNASLGSITEVPREAFSGCIALSSILLPKTVTIIGVRAFSGCVTLEKVVSEPQSSLVSINSQAFSATPALKILMLTATTPPQTEGIVFSEDSALSILAPNDYVDDYKIGSHWSAYSTKIRSSTVEVTFYADGEVYYRGAAVFGSDLTDIPPLPQKNGYTANWSKENFSKISKLDERVDAVFSPIDITVVFRTQDADIVRYLKFGAAITDIPPVPHREGYQGLWDRRDFGSITQTDLVVLPIYSPIEYTIKFMTSGGEAIAEFTAAYGSEISLPSGTKTGNNFHGWYTSETLNEQFSLTAMPARNLTLWAKFLPKNYNLTFDTSGGLKLSGLLQQYNTLIEAVPSREGHTFVNWYDNADCQGEPVIRVPAQDIVLYAKWRLTEYSIAFVPNGGENVPALTYEFEEELPQLPESSRNGYDFAGWYQDYYLQTPFSYENMPSRALTLYAKWSRKQYQVNFVTDGITLATKQVLFNDFITYKPERLGYLVTGYFVDEAKTAPYILGRMPSNDLTVYVEWRPITYSIQYILSGGQNAAVNPTSYDFEVLKQGDIILNEPQREGYSFSYWYIFVDNCETQISRLTAGDFGNKTVYAKWQINSYTLDFVTYSEPLASVTAIYNQTFSAEVLRAGYTFSGWYFDAEYSQKLEKLKIPSKNATLYARWQAISYSITYINGYTHPNKTSYTVEDESFDLISAERIGYSFVEWRKDGATITRLVIDKQNPVDITLSAWWQINRYTLTFDTAGGQPLASIDNAEYNSSISEAKRTTTKEHYIFDGWYDASYSQKYSLTRVPAQSMTLYAKWTPVEYRIGYNLDGVGNNPLNVSAYTTEDTVIFHPISKYGYIFLGWYDNKDFSGEPLAALPVGSGRYLQLYPKWQAVESTISFVSNGAAAVESVTQAYNTELSAPQTPLFEGYELEGWYSDELLSQRFVFERMPAEDITLYAKWTALEYTITYLADIIFENNNTGTYTVEIGEILLLPADAYGYNFIKWYLDGDSAKTPYTTIPSGNTGDITLRAELTPIVTEVTLNAGLGLIGALPFVKLYIAFGNSAFELPLASLVGRVFLGWADSSGTRYADGGGNALRRWDKTVNVTLTAVWAAQYNINSAGVITGLSGGISPESLIIPSSVGGVAVKAIGDNAFTNNGAIKYVEVSSGVKTIGNNAFNNCTNLESVALAESVMAIGNNAFANCGKLKSINLPPKGSEIGTAILRGCGALENLKFSTGITLQKLFGNSVFQNTYEVIIDGTKHYVPNTLSTVTVSNGLKVADYALFGAVSVKNIILQNIIEIGARAFSGCSAAETVYLPSMLQSIDIEAFDGCIKAEYIYTSLNALTEIRERAFRNNRMLDYFYADNIVSILDGAFGGCAGLKGMTFHGTNTVGKIFGTAEYDGSYAVQQGGTTYHMPSSLISVKLSSRASVLWQDAFKDSKIYEINNTSMLTQIGKNAFKNSEILGFVVGDRVVQIADGAFAFCQNLISFLFDNINLSTQDGSIGEAILDGDMPQSLCINGKIVTAKLFGSSGGNYQVELENRIFSLPNSLIDLSVMSVQEIAPRAFFGIKTLFGIDIPSTVVNIGESAFADCINLSAITMPEGVVTIGNGAFGSCGQLTSISVSSTVSSIGQNIFDGCSSLYYVSVDSANSYYETIDNVLFTKDGKKLIFYPRTKTDNYYEVKNSVTEIYPSVFAENGYLTAIALPASLSTVGANAFYNNTQLQLIFGGFENLEYIGDKAFYNCINGGIPQDLSMPELSYIGESAFENCGFVGGVTCGEIDSIGSNAFKNSSIVSFAAQYVNSVASSAFKDCSYLTAFNAETLSNVAESAFEGCVNVQEFTLPSDEAISYYFGAIPPLKKIAFSNNIIEITAEPVECPTLTEIYIPKSVTNIRALFFAGFPNLSSMAIDPSNTSLSIQNNAVIRNGNKLLYYLPYATVAEYAVQNDITEIKDYVFSNHKYLEKITLPSSIFKIGTGVFYDTAIKDLTLLCDLPNGALGYLDSLERLTYNGGSELGKLFSNISNGYSAVQNGVTYVIPSNLTEVTLTSSPAPHALENCGNITKVILGTLNTIAKNAFNGCVSLVEINLENITTIGDKAFNNCQSLAELSLPENLVAVGVQVFDNTAWLENQTNGLVYLRNFVYSYKGDMPTNYSLEFLPGTTDAVQGIFIGMNRLYSVSFPDGIKNMSGFVFSECTSLQQVDFSKISDLKEIPPYMFSGCSQLNEIILNSGVESIGNYAFYDCGSLSEIVLPSSLSRIGSYAFSKTAITSIIVPDNAATIGENVFYGCDLLESVTLGSSFSGILNGVRYVRTLTYDGDTPAMKLFGKERNDLLLYPVFYEGQNHYVASTLNKIIIKDAEKIKPFTFFGLSSVIDIILQEGITDIGNYAFQNSGIQQISLPESLSSVGAGIFKGCNMLEIITLQSYVEDALSASQLKELHYYGDSMLLKVFSKYQYDNTYVISYGARSYYVPNSFERVTFHGEIVGNNASLGINSLTSIEVSSGVKDIGSNAFSGYGNALNIEEPQNLTNIGKDAFLNCRWYENYISNQNGLVQIGKIIYGYAGEMADNHEMLIPEGVIDITDGAFAGYGNLSRVSLPSTLLALGAGVFKDCVSLISVDFASTLVSIGEEAFSGCLSLADICFPENLEVLGRRAFAGCDFEEVIINEKLTEIGKAPFEKSAITVLILQKEYGGILEECFVSKIIMPGEKPVHYLFTEKPFSDGYSVTGIGGTQAVYYIPNTLMEIELTQASMVVAYAFKGIKLRKITLGDVSAIQSYAFADCQQLDELNIPSGVCTIGQYAFYKCYLLDISGFSELSLTAIGNNAFEDCDLVEEFVLAETLNSIGKEIFKNCDNLQQLTIYSDAPEALAGARIANLKVYNNINIQSLFDSSALTYLKKIETLSSSSMPDGYFSGLAYVEEIRICDDIVSIGADIFEGCESLIRVYIPYIGETLSAPGLFSHLFVTHPPRLRIVTVTKQQIVAQSAFENSLLTIVTYIYSVTAIGNRAFYNCQKLSVVEMSSSSIEIGDSAFEQCGQLIEIGSHTDASLGAKAFYLCALFDGEGLFNTKSIGNQAFYGAISLVSAGIDEDTTQIGASAFKGCVLFNQSTFNALEVLGESAFENCASLTAADFSGNTSLQGILNNVFKGCTALAEVNLSGSVIKTVGAGAFQFTALSSFILPDSVTAIGGYAFGNCSSLTRADLGSGIKSIGAYAFSDTLLANIDIPGGVIIYGKACFKNTQLSSFVINTVAAPNELFAGCTELSDIVISEGLQSIGDMAFSGTAIASILLPSTVTSIGEKMFLGCLQLESIEVASGNISFVDIDGVLFDYIESASAEFDGEGNIISNIVTSSITKLICYPSAKKGSQYAIPHYYSLSSEQPLFEISPYAFWGNGYLTGVTLPNSLEVIGDYAFENCSALSSIDLLGTQLQTVGIGVFKDCQSLTDVSFSNSLISIPEAAFQNCTSLTNIFVPAGVRSIGAYAFSGSGLQSFIFANGSQIDEIGEGAFKDCSALTSINIQALSGYHTIRAFTFENCSSLILITIPENVNNIERFAFSGCASLQAVTVNCASLYIGEGVFRNCISLQNLIIPSDIMSIGKNVFFGCTEMLSITFSSGKYVSIQGDFFTDMPALQAIYVGQGAIDTYLYYYPEYAHIFVGI